MVLGPRAVQSAAAQEMPVEACAREGCKDATAACNKLFVEVLGREKTVRRRSDGVRDGLLARAHSLCWWGTEEWRCQGAEVEAGDGEVRQARRGRKEAAGGL